MTGRIVPMWSKCSIVVHEVLENKNRATSDGIGQFYGWLCFGYTQYYIEKR